MPAGRSIGNLHTRVRKRKGSLTLTFKQVRSYLDARIKGFESESAARAYLARVRAGLCWATVNLDVGFNANKELGTIIDSPDRINRKLAIFRAIGHLPGGRIDGLADSDSPVVYQSGKTIRYLTISGTAHVEMSFDTFFRSLKEGISFPNSDRVIADSRLQTGFDLLSAYHFEKSSRGRLLTLVMALEALVEQEERPRFILRLLTKWRSEIARRKSRLQPAEAKFEELKGLEDSIRWLDKKSFSSEIAHLVKTILEARGDPDADALSKSIKKVYQVRSRLVHTGKVPEEDLRWAVPEAKKIVDKVLKARFLILAE